MRLGKWLVLTKWLGWLWIASLVMSLVLALASFQMAKSAQEELREGWRSKNTSVLAKGVSELGTSAQICRIGLALPALETLRLVPKIGRYIDAAGHACGVARNFDAATNTPAGHQLIRDFGSRELSGSTLQDHTLVRQIFEAATSSAPYLRKAALDMRALDEISLPGPVDTQIAQLSVVLNQDRVENILSLAKIGPTLLGLDRPRTYFVALLSEAEMRAGGGFLGQFAIIKFDRGTVTIRASGSNANLPSVGSQNQAVLKGTTELFGSDNPEWVNINLSPHGPDAGSSAVRNWYLGTGEKLDGYLALDVTTASRLAAVAGEGLVTAKGVRLLGAQAMADYAQNGVYFDFASPSESAGPRKKYQAETFQQLLRQTATSLSRLDSLLSILPQAMEERRLTLWFADAGVQRQIAASPVARDVRTFPRTLSVTFNNGSGNKFDYYLQLQGTVTCRQKDVREFTLGVKSTADPKVTYPLYIGQRLDRPGEKRASTFNQYLVELPAKAELRYVKLDGALIDPRVVKIGGRAFVEAPFEIAAGQERKLVVSFWGQIEKVQLPGQRPIPISCNR